MNGTLLDRSELPDGFGGVDELDARTYPPLWVQARAAKAIPPPLSNVKVAGGGP
jgi:hypothetical protein